MSRTANVDQTARPRPRRRWLRRLVVGFVVLLGLLVAADFGAAALFEYQVSKRARTTFGLADDPSVKVGGFSFLAQAVSGEYQVIKVEANGIPVLDTLTDTTVEADLFDVAAPLSSLLSGTAKDVVVGEAEGKIKVKATDVNRVIQRNTSSSGPSIADLRVAAVSEEFVADPAAEKPSGEQVADESGGTAGVKLGATVTVGGDKTDIDVFAIISVADGAITVTPKRLAVRSGPFSGAELPQAVQQAILPLFGVTIQPGQLPFNVTPTSVGVTDDGLLTIGGRVNDVRLTGSG